MLTHQHKIPENYTVLVVVTLNAIRETSCRDQHAQILNSFKGLIAALFPSHPNGQDAMPHRESWHWAPHHGTRTALLQVVHTVRHDACAYENCLLSNTHTVITQHDISWLRVYENQQEKVCVACPAAKPDSVVQKCLPRSVVYQLPLQCDHIANTGAYIASPADPATTNADL